MKMACNKHHDLKKVFENAAISLGVPAKSLKRQQVDAVVSLLEGKDTFVNLPTGFGKSLIYQSLPLCNATVTKDETPSNVSPTTTTSTSTTATGNGSANVHGIVIVVSPLTSLVNEQISQLESRGVPAVNLATCSQDLEGRLLRKEGFSGVVFSSPEYLLGAGSAYVKSESVQTSLIAICVDESHCVVKWGHNSKQFTAFRESYGRISELRSLVPRHVPLLALTATASLEARTKIIQSLGMCTPTMIIESPEKTNIRYSHVHSSFREDNPIIFKCLANELEVLGVETSRTVIFCRTHRQVRNLYSYFRGILSAEAMAMVAMFHSTTDESRKEIISSSFQSADGTIRILFCTIAFRMGVNVQGVTRVIHFGPPESIDDYVQESGRAGRGGEQSYGVLVSYPGCSRHKISAQMKEYVKDTQICRRKLLLEPFGYDAQGSGVNHLCCDICAHNCKCSDDGLKCSDEHHGATEIEKLLKISATKKSARVMPAVRDVDPKELDKLREFLSLYWRNLLPEGTEVKLLCGRDVALGFPNAVIEWIIRDVEFIDSAEYFHTHYPFFNPVYSQDIWGILCKTVGPPHEGSYSDIQTLESETSESASESSLEEDTDYHYSRYRAVVVYSSSESD